LLLVSSVSFQCELECTALRLTQYDTHSFLSMPFSDITLLIKNNSNSSA
jgi:hypothetical protein